MVRACQVSDFLFLHLIDTDALYLYLYRFNLDVDGSTAGSNDPIQTFRAVWEWLCAAHTFEVSCFGFMALADFSRFEFNSSASMETSNESVRTF